MQGGQKNMLELFLQYYTIIIHKAWLIIAITGLITTATVIFALVSIKLPPEESPLPNYYTAHATLFVSQNEQTDISGSILRALGAGQTNSTAAGFSNGDMILFILRSRTILDRIIEEFKMYEKYSFSDSSRSKVRDIVSNSFNFEYSRNTGSLMLSYVSSDPVFARDVVNRTVELLDEWFVMNRGIAKQKSKEILEEKLQEVKASIDTLQGRLRSLQQRYGVLNAEELGVTQATSLANLRSQLIMKEIEIKNYSIYSKINDPRLEQLNEELENLRTLIAQNQTIIPTDSTQTGRQRTLADVAQEFSQLTNELDIQQRIYNTLSPQYEAAKLSPESEPMFQIFELAEVPDMKTGPKRSELVIMAFGGSLAFSVGLVLLMNILAVWKKEIAQRNKNAV